MKTITVAELRQNPTAALEEVERGETYVVTKHRRPVARLVPPIDENDPLAAIPGIIWAREPNGPSRLSELAKTRTYSYEETEALLEEMKSEW